MHFSSLLSMDFTVILTAETHILYENDFGDPPNLDALV